jgi:GGDEF domain-containing protein
VLNDIQTAIEANRIAKSIERMVWEPLESNSTIVNVSLSIGVALFPLDGVEVDALLQAADTAMYVEKRARRGRTDSVEKKD